MLAAAVTVVVSWTGMMDGGTQEVNACDGKCSHD